MLVDFSEQLYYEGINETAVMQFVSDQPISPIFNEVKSHIFCSCLECEIFHHYKKFSELDEEPVADSTYSQILSEESFHAALDFLRLIQQDLMLAIVIYRRLLLSSDPSTDLILRYAGYIQQDQIFYHFTRHLDCDYSHYFSNNRKITVSCIHNSREILHTAPVRYSEDILDILMDHSAPKSFIVVQQPETLDLLLEIAEQHYDFMDYTEEVMMPLIIEEYVPLEVAA